VTMPSRGIGAVMDSKMPKAKTITRKDDPNKVEMFKGGGFTPTSLPRKNASLPVLVRRCVRLGQKVLLKRVTLLNAAKTASFKEGGSILLATL
jgi:hypothetical protein